MDAVVSPFDHRYELPADEVRVIEPPSQKVVAPPAVIVGAAGAAGAESEAFRTLEGQPEALVNVMLYAPSLKVEIVVGRVTPVMLPEAVPVQERVPVPVPVIWMEPSLMVHEVGLETVPNAIVGVGLTVTTVTLEDGD